MKIAIASDHAGLPLKQAILRFLTPHVSSIEDLGPLNSDSTDYPDFASEVAKKVSSQEVEAGILICGSGQGMAMTANKFKGVRAACVGDLYSARMAKEHNNANVLTLGARTLDPAKAVRLIKAWLKSSFKGNRHQTRLDKIARIEEENFK